jgi:hypothetical protein
MRYKLFLIVIPIIVLLFSPALAYFISTLFLVLLANYSIEQKQKYFIFIGSITLISLLLIIGSYELFLYTQDDFTNYYNNYLLFLNNGFSTEYFEYGFGVEIGVPLLHYIFSLTISENTPYLILLLHASLQLLLLTYIVVLISKYYKLEIKYTILLFVFTIILFKYGMAMNQLRQAYASLFIIIAIFSKNYKMLYCLTAILFHVSSLFIYPLVNFLLLSKSTRRLKQFSFISIAVAIVLYVFINTNFESIISIENIFLNKVKLFILMSQKVDSFVDMLPISEIIYITFLIIFFKFLTIYYKIKTTSQWNLYAILIFTIAFSFLHGIPARILSAIFTFLLGFLFVKYLVIEIKVKQAYLFALILIILFQIKFTFYNNLYFRNYPLASVVPLYYVPELFKPQGYVDRYNLPSKNDLNLQKRIEEIK